MDAYAVTVTVLRDQGVKVKGGRTENFQPVQAGLVLRRHFYNERRKRELMEQGFGVQSGPGQQEKELRLFVADAPSFPDIQRGDRLQVTSDGNKLYRVLTEPRRYEFTMQIDAENIA